MLDFEELVNCLEGNGTMTLERLFVCFSIIAQKRYQSVPFIISLERNDPDDITAGEMKISLGKGEFIISQASGGYFVEFINRMEECRESIGYGGLFRGLNLFFNRAEKIAFCN